MLGCDVGTIEGAGPAGKGDEAVACRRKRT